MIDQAERKALISALRDQTEFGRLNAAVIEAGFDKIVELGFEIVKKEELKPVAEAKPEPVERFASQPRTEPKPLDKGHAKRK